MAKIENLKNILGRRLRHYGLEKQALAARVCALAAEVSGGEFELVSFKNGALKVKVLSPARAHLLKLKQEQIISALNEKIGAGLVKRIRFEIER